MLSYFLSNVAVDTTIWLWSVEYDDKAAKKRLLLAVDPGVWSDGAERRVGLDVHQDVRRAGRQQVRRQ